jgi:hypothetical protein
MAMRRREFIAALGGACAVFLCESASAQEGYYGADHDNGIRTSTRSSKEMTAMVRAAT